MRRLSFSGLVLAVVSALVTAVGLPAPAAYSALPSCSGRHWVASWYAAPSDALLSQPPIEQTFRIQVSPLRGGTVARFRFSNRFGSGPVTFGDATVGKQHPTLKGAALEAGTLHNITFSGGHRRVVIARGREVLSDPVRIRFGTFGRLLVSVHVVGAPGPATQHAISEQTTWQSPPLSGDHTHDLRAASFVGLPLPGLVPTLPQGIPYLTGMDVRARNRVGTVVTFGDSITDGTEAEVLPFVLSADNIDKFVAYPDQLARRIQNTGLPFSVANSAISGNMLLNDAVVPVFGQSGVSRFTRDALDRPGVTTVILLEGINDIGQLFATRDQLVAGYRKAIAAAHARGVRILLGTLTAQNGTLQPPNYGLLGEPTRVAVNQWIRGQRLSDGVVDFDKAVRDPADPSRIRPAYDGGDHLHFNAAGYRAMAAAVPLTKLKRAACR
jgi:lysophospholipase L1-like esterase